MFINAIDYFKEKSQKLVTAENFNSKKLMYEDKINPDISPKEFMKNLEQSKYCSQDIVSVQYENPLLLKTASVTISMLGSMAKK